ncbi:MAG: zinc-dependent metalloprotease [Bacteroidota bacterium]|nr:zinc-dependent metalloprotease [Bacteroidota bacterium]
MMRALGVAAFLGGGIWVVAQEPISAALFLRPAEQVLQPQSKAAYWVQKSFLQAVAMLPVAELELVDFPIGMGETGRVHVRRGRSVVDGQTQWWRGVAPARGACPELLEPMSGITQYVFFGTIVGELGSQVLLSIVGGEIYAFIWRANGRYLGIVPTGQRWGEEYEHVLSTAVGEEMYRWTCAIEQTADYWEQVRALKEPRGPVPQATTLRQARVALETTSSLYTRFNRDYDRVAAYVVSVFAMVSRIYEDEVNVTFTLPWILIWMTPPDGEEDPYSNDSNIGALLSEVTTYWNQNRRSVTRDLVHVMTAPGTTAVGGIARLNSLCTSSNAYSVSGIRGNYQYPTLSYTWDVFVVAHEIGHVFGAPHTHACYWSPPLDTCVTQDGNPYPTPDACYRSPITPRSSWDGGSIMSYCHLVQPTVAVTFRPRVAAVVRNSRAEACLAQPPAPTLLLQHPVGNQQFRGGQEVEIRWTSVQVQSVTLEYSADSMQTWERIATGIPASQRLYRWQLPQRVVPAIWLRIYSATNPTVGDTTMASFSIAVPALTLTAPAGGERYGHGERVTVEWSSTLVPAVNLLFSQNNGQRWDTLAHGVTGRSYQWTIPRIQTEQAVVRVEDTAIPALYSQSAPFAIGVPTLRLLTPNGGERWTAGTRQLIRWESDFISRLRIEYSTDGGSSWMLIRTTYDARQQSYEWLVPNTPTEQALVRLRNLSNQEQTVQSAAPFVIEALSAAVRRDEEKAVLLISAVVEGEWVWVLIQSAEPLQSARIQIATLLGRVLHEVRWEHIPAGERLLSVPLPVGLANGAYFLLLRSYQGQWVFPFKLVR